MTHVQIGGSPQHPLRRIASGCGPEILASHAKKVALAATDIQPCQSLRVHASPPAKSMDNLEFALEKESAAGRKPVTNGIVDQRGIVIRILVKCGGLFRVRFHKGF